MKKFISMVLAAAMVVSLVPATAFAYEVTSTAKVLDVAEMTKSQAETAKTAGVGNVAGVDTPELQITVSKAETTAADKSTDSVYEFDLKLSKAEWKKSGSSYIEPKVTIEADAAGQKYVEDVLAASVDGETATFAVDYSDWDKDEVTVKITFTDDSVVLADDDKVIVNLKDVLVKKSTAGAEAKITLKSDDLGVKAEDMVFAVVQENVLEIEADDTVDVAEEEIVTLKEITVEAATGYLPSKAAGDGVYDLKLKLNSGFEFINNKETKVIAGVTYTAINVDKGSVVKVDGDEVFVKVDANTDKIKITNLAIEADTAKAGDVATIKVTATDWDAASCEVATVVGEGLTIEVDEDEDVPEMWSGVKVNSTDVLTDDDDNVAKTITIKETVAGSYSNKEEVELVLPEGVVVVGVDAKDIEGDGNWDDDEFFAAYQEGDHQSFKFKKRTIGETTTEAYEVEVDLTLIAVPGFVGDVTAELLVDGESVGSVVIATFKTPVVVEAQANDLKIDYRNTEVGSDIVVKEAEAGLWKSGTWFAFGIEKFADGAFEDDAVYTTNEDASDMTVDTYEDKEANYNLGFKVDDESDEEAGEVTISNISLYMDRNLAAGAYDLKMTYAGAADFYTTDLYAPDCVETYADNAVCVCTQTQTAKDGCACTKDECIVADVYEVEDVVKEGFVNIVTAGREQDDASFTTKVVVPVGEAYIVAGENTVTLDVPAYVSAAGYTMLPVRAVATALGISNNNVLWDAATKTVTILYGQRIITMQVGSKVINVNGSAIPASASVEIVNGRTFLPMRDLATALGVTDITWDAATKTATLNGSL